MPTTTNYGWTTPADTDLVKDGASAIRTLGTAIDTTVFNNAGAAINKTIVDAKGDLIVASGADAVARLAVGTNDYVLTADSAATNGIKWAAIPASGGLTLLDTMSLSGASTTSTTFSSAYTQLFIYVKQARLSSGSDGFYFRLNGDSGNNYVYAGPVTTNATAGVIRSTANSGMHFGVIGDKTSVTQGNYATIYIFRPSDTDVIHTFSESIGFDENAVQYSGPRSGIYDNTAAITSVTLFPGSGSMAAGTAYIYGVN